MRDPRPRTSSLLQDIDACFGHEGFLARSIDGFSARPAQATMAAAVGRAIESVSDLLIEAGTGTGKTLAYLLPLLLSGKRAIISTGTRTLQDQLWSVDLPRLKGIAPVGVRLALLKGRSNYVCPRRLDVCLGEYSADDETRSRLIDIRQWASRTRTGDLGEVTDGEADSRLIPLVTSTADNCQGRACENFDACPLYRARARALEADLVVVNHHLLFSDLSGEEEAMPSLLPRADVIVMDEAHQAPHVARQFFGRRLGSAELIDLLRDIGSEFQALGSEDVGLAAAARDFESVFRRLSRAWSTSADCAGSDDLIEQVDLAFAALATALSLVRERSRIYEHCYQRVVRFADLFALLTESDAPAGYAKWLERQSSGFSLHLAPVSIADEFGERVRAAAQSWILTSATLTVDGSFEHVAAELGLGDVQTMLLESPFDYRGQVKGWLPPLEALPGSREHTSELVECTLPLLHACAGRTFMLFTSYRAMFDAEALLASRGVACLVQTRAPRSRLLTQFRQTERAVLLATQSFWEGVDVRGTDLRLLVIDKLPFPSPESPIIRARMDHAVVAGSDGFDAIMLPQAITGLRQGFGRLVRSETDRGLFVLGDTRVKTRAYGRRVRASLPDMDWLDSADEAVRAVGSLSRADTEISA